jgi:hypothetical protein
MGDFAEGSVGGWVSEWVGVWAQMGLIFCLMLFKKCPKQSNMKSKGEEEQYLSSTVP